MSNNPIQVCLVSDQLLPNLIPALISETRPEEVILMVTPEMQRKGKATLLAQILREEVGCQVTIRDIEAYRIETVRNEVLDLVAGREGQPLALNATGGTKIMAMAASEVFRELGLTAFYIDTEHGQQVVLHPKFSVHDLPAVVGVRTYLRAHGYLVKEVGSCQTSREHRELATILVQNAKRLHGAIGLLNKHAENAKQGLCATLDAASQNNAQFQEVLALFSTAKILGLSGNHLVFVNEEARFFANGGWLEGFVRDVVNRLRREKFILDHLCNAQVANSQGVRNELDLVFTARNRLHIIECKTANLISITGRQGRADNATYKIGVLKDLLGGTFGRAMMVTFRPLAPADRERCAAYKIKVVEADDIARLEEKVRFWIDER